MHVKWLDFEWNVLHIIAGTCASRLPLTACVVFFPPLHFEYGSSLIFDGCEQDNRIEILCAALLLLHYLPAHSHARVGTCFKQRESGSGSP
jgi:hypothetical protein